MKKWNIELREWQRTAFEIAARNFKRGNVDFLCVATPGAGKTVFALKVVRFLFEENLIDRIVVVCPTEHLKRQWAESAHKAGISIDPNFQNSKIRETRDYKGASLTYAQVGKAPKTHKNNCDAKRTFVIFDEIHHLGDNLSWGNAARMAFTSAAFRLSISGTPFRRDNNPIPFVKYVKEKCKWDYMYGYSEAIRDKTCRPVFFPAFEGKMEWKASDHKIYKSTFEETLDRTKSSERLRTALDHKGEWLRTVIKDADRKLTEIRKNGDRSAGGLLIAIDQNHARKIAKLMEQITKDAPAVVVSDEPKASKKIAKFCSSNAKWMVAVKMVSEGVDIPRLRVGVYATNVKSELFFRQAVGRFVRNSTKDAVQDAYFYIPKEPSLVYFAKQIEAEREHDLNKKRINEDFPEENGSNKKLKDESKNGFEAISSFATDKFQLELDFGPEFLNSEIDNIKTKKKREKRIIDEKEEIPVFEQIAKLREDIQYLSKRVAIKLGANGKIDWNFAHREWIRLGGKPIEFESFEELQKRKKWLLNKL